MQDDDSTWVQPIPGVSRKKYNRAWRAAVKALSRVQPIPAPFRVYLLTDTVTGKSYVGMTKRSLKDRWARHIYRALSPERENQASCLCVAIREHGSAAFEWRVLSEAVNEMVAYQLEKFWIRQFRTLDPHGYNMTEGGKVGFRWSRKIRVKMRDTQIARMTDPANREALRKARTRLERQRAYLRGRRTRRLRASISRRAVNISFP